jgi:hypothetical protein
MLETPSKQESNLIGKVRTTISHHALIARGDKAIVGIRDAVISKRMMILREGL